jgi:4'-phosphopantetheinyl transferase
VRRGRLREVLARRLGKDPARLRLEQGPFGKPALAAEKIQFSLAHSAGRMMIAICDVEVGCDLERIDPLFDWPPIAEAVFSKGERDYLARMPAVAGTRLFFDWWARKEAVVKAIGQGLSYPAHEIDLSVASGKASALGKHWSITPIAAVPGFAAALAVPAGTAALRMRR